MAHARVTKTLRPPDRRPLANFGTLRITDSPVALLIALGLAAILYAAVPALRPVLLAIPVGGAIVGVLLWLKHR